MKKKSVIFIICFLAVPLILYAQESGRRVALVIGNADYKSSSLQNPVNDARDISQVLREFGFSVTTKLNCSHREMTEAIREFGNELVRGGVGLFYYSGHGMQVGGRNYLIPVDADIQSEDEVKYFTVDAGLVLSKMESAGNRTNIVILDACRDNPFKWSFRTGSRGLCIVEAPRGSLVIYATAPGSVAAEGRGRNGIFTRALLGHIKTPGMDVELMLKRVRKDFIEVTGNTQIPRSSSSLTEDFYFIEKPSIIVQEPSKEEHISRKGSSVELSVGYNQMRSYGFGELLSDTVEVSGVIFSVFYIYQFNNIFSLGLGGSYNICKVEAIWPEPAGPGVWDTSIGGPSIKLIFGNKVDSFAFSVVLGILAGGKNNIII